MNTKLITFASGLLAVGALVLSYGVGCGDDDDIFMTNAPAANTAATNVAATNVAATNGAATNVAATNGAATNVAATNGAATNVTATNVGTTNAPGMSGEYLDTGVLKGYCFGLQIVNNVEEKWTFADQLCGNYNLPGTSWDDIAMIGCNVNQPETGGEGSEGTLVPTFSQICVYGSGFQRIQIQGPNGATDANDRWCAPVPEGGGCVALSTFNTQCWEGGSGTAYTNQPLAQVAALMPSQSDGETVAVKVAQGTLCVSSVSTQ